MKLDRNDLLNLILIVIASVMTAIFYDQMPDPTPTHWNLQGVADGFTPKPWGPYILPLGMLGITILFILIPIISPKGYRIEKFRSTYSIWKLIPVAFMFFLNFIIIFKSMGTEIPIERLVPALVGIIFIILGNYMGKLTKNFFIGIRTPWTLANDEVWLRTHRFGGKVFVIGGFLFLVASLVGLNTAFLMTFIILVSLCPTVYSYIIYKKLEGFSGE